MSRLLRPIYATNEALRTVLIKDSSCLSPSPSGGIQDTMPKYIKRLCGVPFIEDLNVLLVKTDRFF